MSEHILELFEDDRIKCKIQKRLPYLFQLAELESSRAGKIGMEVGSIRERIIVALLIYKFGEKNVKTEIPITEHEIDALLFDQPISIKTITGKILSGVKLIWTVDAEKARQFNNSYYPQCDILLAQINWGSIGGFYYISLEAQKRIFDLLGRERYIKLPIPGTNPRGVEINKEALTKLVCDNKSRKIMIEWNKTNIEYDPYKRWIDLWKED
ncbi:MAG: hypothetical protein BWX81_00630 [Spirochaetes bacterium ADurb.Bin110]|nr:MAG: hypothetical protein BWX81_00630 [Spirochaetes bacterium ADurb.Bin110]HRS21974.1 ThaI family type II restriction endonuclease [Clostridia bacterium]